MPNVEVNTLRHLSAEIQAKRRTAYPSASAKDAKLENRVAFKSLLLCKQTRIKAK